MRKLLYILSVLLLSTVQIEAMQNNNNQLTSQNDTNQYLNKISNILDNVKIEKIKKEEILSNVRKINDEKKLSFLSAVLKKLPDEDKTEEILFNISRMDQYTLKYLIRILTKLPEAWKKEEILLNIIKMDVSELYSLSNVLGTLPEESKT